MSGEALPADRGGIATERINPRSGNLHALGVRACVDLIAREDRAVLDALERASGSLAGLIGASEPGFCRGGRLISLGAGTSGRLAVLDASEAPPTFQVDSGRVVGIIAGGDSALRVSSEEKEDDPRGALGELEALELTDDDTVLGLAAGGTTPYARGALAIAKELSAGCVTGLITCARVDPPAGCDHMIVLETGPEVVTGSTRMKAGTATKLALNTISTTLMIRSGRVYRNLMVDLRATNDKLRDRAARIVSTLTGLEREASFELLSRARGGVKAAVVMQRLGVDVDEAERRLAEAGGRLERVIGD
ncbi:MAG: N-acetylmuramic acid 6-phosphate etherase [Planctomycetota bacterium]